MNLSKLVYRITIDPDFAAIIRNAPAEALNVAGLSINADELRALKAIIQDPQRVAELMTSDILNANPIDWMPLNLKPGEA